LGVAVSFYGRAWSTSGLIHGITKQSSGEVLSLYQMSDYGKLHATEVIKIRIFPGLLFSLVVVALSSVLIALGLLLSDAEKILLVPSGILYAIVVTIAGVVVGASVRLGILAINLHSLKWKDGFKEGFTIFKKYFFDVLVMSVINCFAGCVFGAATLVALALLGGIGAACIFGVMAFNPFLIAAGPIIFLAIIAFIMFVGIVSAVATVFKQSTWVLLYKQLTEVINGQQ